jgi:hypothetical protein
MNDHQLEKTIKIIRCLLRNLQEVTENENAYDNAENDSVSFNECEAMLISLKRMQLHWEI